MKIKKPRVCIDIDNVIAQTDEVMRRVIMEYTGGLVRLAYEDVKEFNYYECRDGSGNGISKEDWGAIHDMFSEPRYLSEIEPLPGAIEGLRELASKAALHIATSRLRKARQTTIEWLDKYGVPDHALHFVGHNEKQGSLGDFIAAVEDHYEETVQFARKGITSFLMAHPWNASKPIINGIERVDCWAELTRRVLTMIGSYE